MCEFMNGPRRSAFVQPHDTDLHVPAEEWSNGIPDNNVNVLATACLQSEETLRTDMREVYLHLAGEITMGEREDEYVNGVSTGRAE